MRYYAYVSRTTHVVEAVEGYGDHVIVRDPLDHYLLDVTPTVEAHDMEYLVGQTFDPTTQTFTPPPQADPVEVPE